MQLGKRLSLCNRGKNKNNKLEEIINQRVSKQFPSERLGCRCALPAVLPSLLDRLGDSKDSVREQDQTLLLKIMDQAANPQVRLMSLHSVQVSNWLMSKELLETLWLQALVFCGVVNSFQLFLLSEGFFPCVPVQNSSSASVKVF